MGNKPTYTSLINKACIHEQGSISPETIAYNVKAYERFFEFVAERFHGRVSKELGNRVEITEGMIVSTGVKTLGITTYLFTYDQLEELLTTFITETLEDLKGNSKYSAEAEKLLAIEFEVDNT